MPQKLQGVLTMSVQELKLRFLLDENVHKRLLIFLKSEGYDVISSPKGITNGTLSGLCKSEKRILVTNDTDFQYTKKDKVYSVVLLRISQYDTESLIKSFSSFVKENSNQKDLQGKLVIITKEKYEVSELSA